MPVPIRATHAWSPAFCSGPNPGLAQAPSAKCSESVHRFRGCPRSAAETTPRRECGTSQVRRPHLWAGSRHLEQPDHKSEDASLVGELEYAPCIPGETSVKINFRTARSLVMASGHLHENLVKVSAEPLAAGGTEASVGSRVWAWARGGCSMDASERGLMPQSH